MTQLDLQQLDRLEQAATPAPWRSIVLDECSCSDCRDADDDDREPHHDAAMIPAASVVEDSDGDCLSRENAECAAAARNSLRALLDLVNELAGALVKDKREYGCDCCHLDVRTQEWVEPQTCATCVALAKFRTAGGAQ